MSRMTSLWDPTHGERLAFDMDDGTGLRVVHARFLSESKFSWTTFDGYDRIRILTYSAGVSAIVRLLDRHGFDDFECVFGCEGTLRTLKDIMAFQQVAIGDARAAIKKLPDERHAFILNRVREGQARFRVLRKRIAHAKLYLLENRETGVTRVLVGSANLSETAFGGRQSETLVSFDDDDTAWDYYLRFYETIRDQASDEISLPPERVEKAEIDLREVPVLDPTDHSTLVIDTSEAEDSQGDVVHINVPTQIERIDPDRRQRQRWGPHRAQPARAGGVPGRTTRRAGPQPASHDQASSRRRVIGEPRDSAARGSLDYAVDVCPSPDVVDRDVPGVVYAIDDVPTVVQQLPCPRSRVWEIVRFALESVIDLRDRLGGRTRRGWRPRHPRSPGTARLFRRMRVQERFPARSPTTLFNSSGVLTVTYSPRSNWAKESMTSALISGLLAIRSRVAWASSRHSLA